MKRRRWVTLRVTLRLIHWTLILNKVSEINPITIKDQNLNLFLNQSIITMNDPSLITCSKNKMLILTKTNNLIQIHTKNLTLLLTSKTIFIKISSIQQLIINSNTTIINIFNNKTISPKLFSIFKISPKSSNKKSLRILSKNIFTHKNKILTPTIPTPINNQNLISNNCINNILKILTKLHLKRVSKHQTRRDCL